MNDRDKLSMAFAELELRDYFAPLSWGQEMCCQSCGWYEVPEGKEDRVVFWHMQDDERAFADSDFLWDDLYIAWAGDVDEICSVIERYDLLVERPENDSLRLKVLA